MKNLFLLMGLMLVNSNFAFADDFDGAYLDAPYKNLIHPIDDLKGTKANFFRSDSLAALSIHSPVKSQGSRGTCSIFSAAAMLESMLKLTGKVERNVDLSEEWLEYLAIASTRSTTDGSYAGKNFSLIAKHGMVTERALPYIEEDWSEGVLSGLSYERCGLLAGNDLTICLIAHFDPNFYKMSLKDLEVSELSGASDILKHKKAATRFKTKYLGELEEENYYIYQVSEVKSLLKQGIPVTVEMDFFYGTWNHRKAADLGIGRDLEAWARGEIGYPEKQSVDYFESRKSENRAGHSVLLIGFDDSKVIETNVLMKNGEYKKFTYQGVYYFKNSWGTDSFGTQTQVDEVVAPGYGVMTQKYAHEYGAFYQFPLK